MSIGLITTISTRNRSKPIKNRVQNSTFWALISRRFFKADKSVLLDVSTWSLLYGYHGVEYRFFIFNSLQKFLYTRLSNCDTLSVTID